MQNGKGDKPRPSSVAREVRDKNYDSINWKSKMCGWYKTTPAYRAAGHWTARKNQETKTP